MSGAERCRFEWRGSFVFSLRGSCAVFKGAVDAQQFVCPDHLSCPLPGPSPSPSASSVGLSLGQAPVLQRAVCLFSDLPPPSQTLVITEQADPHFQFVIVPTNFASSPWLLQFVFNKGFIFVFLQDGGVMKIRLSLQQLSQKERGS